ncbi:MAG: hypothetical protein MPJ50_09610 [Pirellulales bacterium]|nr:hypothetical protein [Pirellulales bacterium]
MSSPLCIVFFGLKIDGDPDLDRPEFDELMAAARQVGLKSYSGKLTETAEKSFLLVGAEIGFFSAENATELELSLEDFQQLIDSVGTKLESIGLHQPPMIQIQWESDY